MGDDYFADENETVEPTPAAKGIETEEAKRIYEFGQLVADYALANLDKDVLAFTGTYTDWASIKFHYAQAHSLAEGVAAKEGEGLLLVCEIGTDGLFHWHGIAITTRSRHWLAANWLYRSPATQEATLVTFVKLQDERKIHTRSFKIELTRAIQYRCQPCPHLPLSLHERAVSAGIMKELWDRAMGRAVIECFDLLYRRVRQDEPAPARDHEPPRPRPRKRRGRPADGLCIRQACRRKIPPKRGPSPYCSKTCRDLDKPPARHGRGRKLKHFPDASIAGALERIENDENATLPSASPR